MSELQGKRRDLQKGKRTGSQFGSFLFGSEMEGDPNPAACLLAGAHLALEQKRNCFRDPLVCADGTNNSLHGVSGIV